MPVATRDEVYAKFGITAEAAQLFETALGTLLLSAEALQKGWNELPDYQAATLLYKDIEKSTLGRLLRSAKSVIEFDDNLIDIFDSALKTRNRLSHGFYERHNFRIQSDDGRDLMFADLEAMHTELFNAWQLADMLSSHLLKYFLELKADPKASEKGPVATIKFLTSEGP